MEYRDFSGKFSHSAELLIDKAMEEASRRDCSALKPEHIFLVWVQKEWDLFASVMKDFNIVPECIIQKVDKELGPRIFSNNRVVGLSQVAISLFQATLAIVQRSGRQLIEPGDLVCSIFDINDSLPTYILRNEYRVDTSMVKDAISRKIRDKMLREEQWKKQFELPPLLRPYANSLNMLVHQDTPLPLFGRGKELNLLIEVLCHRGGRPNSALLVGEPGVGKTAIVEDLARKIELEPETIPVRLRRCHIISLQMNPIVAGTMLRGMFEEKIQHVIQELKKRRDIIVFIDDFHTVIGAGTSLGASSDAADIFKSVIARGEIRIIGATTLGEYRAYVQEDEALARRFRVIMVNELTPEETKTIIHRLKPTFEENYGVEVSDEAIATLVGLSPRYCHHLNSPDKQIGWLDTACVRAEINESLKVAPQDIIDVIADTCKIPSEMVSRDVADRLKNIEQKLAVRVVGQQNAIKSVTDRLRLNKGPLKEKFERPNGVFLFIGPTGVGKTELAKALAEFLFGYETKMVRIDMSEYQDGIVGVNKLIGMPRGIIGSEHGGLLTDKIRENPYSVILLDEIEKANPLIYNLFLQAFDEGWLTDGKGRRVYLSDSIIIMTSNLGSRYFRKLTNHLGFGKSGSIDANLVKSDVLKEVEQCFSPEFRNRIDQIIFFSPLTMEEVRKIVEINMARLKERFISLGKVLEVEPAVIDFLASKGYSLELGARFLKRKIDELISIPLSAAIKDSICFHICIKDNSVEINTSPVPSGTADYQVVV